MGRGRTRGSGSRGKTSRLGANGMRCARYRDGQRPLEEHANVLKGLEVVLGHGGARLELRLVALGEGARGGGTAMSFGVATLSCAAFALFGRR